MHDFITDHASSPTTESVACLFMWRGAGIILIGERDGERWVLARAWLEGDTLVHVRRWNFAQQIPFSGQVRRLVMDATADFLLAREQGLRALSWTEANS